jgi:phosphoglycolate phosphatase-like HAD superfamily hydrolase
VLHANDVRSRFCCVHGADDVPAAKPSPEGILQCLREMNVRPHEAVYIGDSPSDGRAALAAGCASVAECKYLYVSVRVCVYTHTHTHTHM